MIAPAGRSSADALRRVIIALATSANDDRSVRHLIRWNTHLLQRRIVERSSRTGEHYVTSTRAEYASQAIDVRGPSEQPPKQMAEVAIITRTRQHSVHRAFAEFGEEPSFAGDAGVRDGVRPVGFGQQRADGRLEPAPQIGLFEHPQHEIEASAGCAPIVAHPVDQCDNRVDPLAERARPGNRVDASAGARSIMNGRNLVPRSQANRLQGLPWNDSVRTSVPHRSSKERLQSSIRLAAMKYEGHGQTSRRGRVSSR